MPKIAYRNIRLSEDSLATIAQANTIIAEYQAQGFDLTLRQLFYQFVSRALIPNNDREYKKLGDRIADGLLAGLIDWNAICDRTRFVRDLAHWDSPADIVDACAKQFRLPKWKRQPKYVEVFIEKDALIGVIEGVCEENDVPYLACRGYASASEIWRAGHNRIKPRLEDGKEVVVLYLGDHDPSGIDMTRDVEERLKQFAGVTENEELYSLTVERLALNMNQVQQYNPPPNPTKTTDSRANWYIEQYGQQCWELDALDPTVIRNLIQNAIDGHRDEALWQEAIEEEDEAKRHLGLVADKWEAVITTLDKKKKK